MSTANAFAFRPSFSDPLETFREAERLLADGNDEEAAHLYATCRTEPSLTPLTLIRLGEIANRRGLAREAYSLFRHALELDPGLAARILPDGDPKLGYVYAPVPSRTVANCPLCGAPGEPHSTYLTLTNDDFIAGFDPVKSWMTCPQCIHLFAGEIPEDLASILSSGSPEYHRHPKLDMLPALAPIMGNLKREATGKRLLEIGVGAGEFSALALEFGFDVEGLDIRPAYAQAVSERLGITVHSLDFMSFARDARYDVVVMGDVIEHFVDPVAAIAQVTTLLSPGGIVWISTPNFQSAFSRLAKDGDPMWRVVEHLNYFSAHSLTSLLARFGFDVFDYSVSRHYYGSMEVSARMAV